MPLLRSLGLKRIDIGAVVEDRRHPEICSGFLALSALQVSLNLSSVAVIAETIPMKGIRDLDITVDIDNTQEASFIADITDI